MFLQMCLYSSLHDRLRSTLVIPISSEARFSLSGCNLINSKEQQRQKPKLIRQNEINTGGELDRRVHLNTVFTCHCAGWPPACWPALLLATPLQLLRAEILQEWAVPCLFSLWKACHNHCSQQCTLKGILSSWKKIYYIKSNTWIGYYWNGYVFLTHNSKFPTLLAEKYHVFYSQAAHVKSMVLFLFSLTAMKCLIILLKVD